MILGAHIGGHLRNQTAHIPHGVKVNFRFRDLTTVDIRIYERKGSLCSLAGIGMVIGSVCGLAGIGMVRLSLWPSWHWDG